PRARHRATTTNVLHLIVSDVASVAARCTAAGMRIVKVLRDQDYGQRAFVVADPDGNRLDIGELL
ncbi:VOC family protein, partial [Clostridium perfringens]